MKRCMSTALVQSRGASKDGPKERRKKCIQRDLDSLSDLLRVEKAHPLFHRSAFLIAWPSLSIPFQETSQGRIALPGIRGRQGKRTKSRGQGVGVADGLGYEADERKRRIAAVSISSGRGAKRAHLTGRDHIYKESSRPRDLNQPGCRGVYDFKIMVIVLFDRIPIN